MTAPATARAVPHGMREIELSIEGMTCAACAVRVEKKLNKLDVCGGGELRDRDRPGHRAGRAAGAGAHRGGRAGGVHAPRAAR